MKKKILLLMAMLPLISCGQTTKKNTNKIQEQLKQMNIYIDDSNLVLDTLLKDRNGIIMSVNDSLNIKKEEGKVSVVYSDASTQLWHIGIFGENAQLPAIFNIETFPNHKILIVMRYLRMGQGIVEESLTLFTKENDSIIKLYPTIFETGAANPGLCPDMEKCYEYKTSITEIHNTSIAFKKQGTYLDYSTNKVKKIDEPFYLKFMDDKWILVHDK